MAELLEDVVGVNKAGLVCHPYKLTRGQKTGQYSYTLETDSNLDYVGIDEAGLRALIESGAFNGRGRVRMLPAGCPPGATGNALSVRRYQGKRMPIR